MLARKNQHVRLDREEPCVQKSEWMLRCEEKVMTAMKKSVRLMHFVSTMTSAR
jgi:hypothetical protein